MNRRTLILLVLLVAALGSVSLWQKRREEAGTFALAERLFPGVVLADILALRLDHIERSFHLRLERGTGEVPWRITDPIEYAAESGMVERLLDVVGHHRGGAPMGNPGTAGFEPPRAVLTVEYSGPDGARRERSIQVGPVDLDGDHVLVRSSGPEGAGPVRRTLRNVDTLLARSLQEWRSHRLSRLAPRALVSLSRTGTVFLGDSGDTVWLDLVVEREGSGWRMLRPAGVRADRDAVELLCAAVARVEVVKFAADVAETREALALFGLDQPEMRLDLADHRGHVEVLEFGRAVIDGTWYARRVGGPHVFEVAGHAVMALTPPAELFMDRRLLRLARDRIQWLEIEGPDGGGPLRISRARGEGRGSGQLVWSVAQGGRTWPADGGRVSAILAVLEQGQVEHYFREGELPQDASGSGCITYLVAGSGTTEGGRIGMAWEAEGGQAGRLFRREDDLLTCLVPEEVAAALSVTVLDLRHPRLVPLEEVALARLLIEGEGGRLAYEHGRDGRWRPAGTGDSRPGAGPDKRAVEEARELLPVLDPLLFLTAERYLPEGGAAPLGDSVRIVLTARDGVEHRLMIGRGEAAEGDQAEARGPGWRAVLADGGLHRLLLELLGP